MKTRSRNSRLPLQAIPTNNTQKLVQEKKVSVIEESSEPSQLVNGAASKHHSNVCELKTKLQSRMKGAPPVKVSTSRKRLASPGDFPAAKRKVKDEKVDKDENLSSSESEGELDYEKLREKNLRDNAVFFSSLGIIEAKEHLQLSNKKPSKPYARKDPKVREVLPKRQSMRLRRIDPEGQPLPDPEPVAQPLETERLRVPSGPLELSDTLDLDRKGVEENHSIIRRSVTSIGVNSCQYKPHNSDPASFILDMKKMQIRTKAKVCKDRLFSVAVHPSETKVLAMAGDKWGRLGFWDIDAGDETVTVYRPHSRPIGHIYVSPTDPHKVYTCSYDSTLRCGDFEKGIFDEIFSVAEEEDDLFRNFDFLSPTSLLLARFRGDVSVIDIRTPSNKADQSYPVCNKYLRTVSVHPLDKNFFITAGTDMEVSLWDIRKLKTKGQNKALYSMPHGRSVSSAYFSPLTGCRILSCSADDTLNIYNVSSSCAEVRKAKTISHNNKTGRWLTPFRAVWHPAREDVFFVGSMKTPRRMEAFGVDGGSNTSRPLHEFQGEVLSSVCSVVQFHPTRPILIGGNSSGYVFPFM